MAPLTPSSSVPGIRWPGLPKQAGAMLLALQYQFEQSQWWPPDAVRAQQLRQLELLLGHALTTVPFYAERLAAAGFSRKKPLTPETWTRLPLLTREQIQDAGAALRSTGLPRGHGKTSVVRSSGSTGKPVAVAKTELSQLYWKAFTLRDHLWHGRDLTGKLAVIRGMAEGKALYPKGLRARSWGEASGGAFTTGPAVLLNVATDLEGQAEWLARENPDYLLTLPTNLLHLARHCGEHGIPLSRLRQVETLGGVLEPEVRQACREAWGTSVADTYSAQEVGYMALQCPEHEHYHVQAEGALVEVLDDENQPCRPGGWGRVVVTPLHNFAMPLVRYDIGDLAEVGEPCPCGRGLPVLRRILGRARNMLTLPSGARVAPGFVNDWFEGFPVAQFQIVQRARDRLEVKIVPRRPFTEAEEAQVEKALLARLPAPFRIAVTYHDEIPRSASGKYEDFRSDLEG